MLFLTRYFFMNGVIAICTFVFRTTCTVGVCVLEFIVNYAKLNDTYHVEEIHLELDASKDTATVPARRDLDDSEVGKAEWVLDMVSLVKVIVNCDYHFSYM